VLRGWRWTTTGSPAGPYNASRGRGYSFLNVGLDVTDPLAAGLTGLLAQPTDVWVCVVSLGATPPRLDRRPSHHELALL
jgi:hypothetical protein